jgi:hypothetical protein
MPVNKELLLKLKEKVLSEPASFDMATWKNNASKYLPEILTPPCNTVACFAGWTCLIAKKDELKDILIFSWGEEASILLGLENWGQANDFFHYENWPSKFRSAYSKADYVIEDIIEDKEEGELTEEQINNLKTLMQKRAEIGAKVIDYLILHDGRLYEDNGSEFFDMQTIEV